MAQANTSVSIHELPDTDGIKKLRAGSLVWSGLGLVTQEAQKSVIFQSVYDLAHVLLG